MGYSWDLPRLIVKFSFPCLKCDGHKTFIHFLSIICYDLGLIFISVVNYLYIFLIDGEELIEHLDFTIFDIVFDSEQIFGKEYWTVIVF